MESPAHVAFISDVHGNVQALKAVLADIKSAGISDIVCLGDIVGYGGNPSECVDIIREAGIPSLLGNHDAMTDESRVQTQTMNPDAKRAIEWTKDALLPDQLAWLAALPVTMERGAFQAAHATLHDPEAWDYVQTLPDAWKNFAHQTRDLCFIGHTHWPAFYAEGEERAREVKSIENLTAGRKQLINVGSVGQPRDRDPRACYLIYRPDRRDVCWRRVEYDIEAAQCAILAAGLPARFAERLSDGR